MPLDRYREPVLVSGTDGVGTKLKLAVEAGLHDSIGIDLVAMCVNDIVVAGAEPLFFLDYYATGKLELEIATDVVTGIARGCELAGAALVGGETAEMPGMYSEGDYDLAGFSVGIVEKSAILDGSAVGAGDVLIGLASSGPHSNGYSLIRKILEVSGSSLSDELDGRPLAEWLLAPTRIYVKSIIEVLHKYKVKKPISAMAHITGGGLPGNLNRSLPDNLDAKISKKNWDIPPVFKFLKKQGNVSEAEMYKVFNMGHRMEIYCAPEHAQSIIDISQSFNVKAQIVGKCEPLEGKKVTIKSEFGEFVYDTA